MSKHPSPNGDSLELDSATLARLVARRKAERATSLDIDALLGNLSPGAGADPALELAQSVLAREPATAPEQAALVERALADEASADTVVEMDATAVEPAVGDIPGEVYALDSPEEAAPFAPPADGGFEAYTDEAALLQAALEDLEDRPYYADEAVLPDDVAEVGAYMEAPLPDVPLEGQVYDLYTGPAAAEPAAIELIAELPAQAEVVEFEGAALPPAAEAAPDAWIAEDAADTGTRAGYTPDYGVPPAGAEAPVPALDDAEYEAPLYADYTLDTPPAAEELPSVPGPDEPAAFDMTMPVAQGDTPAGLPPEESYAGDYGGTGEPVLPDAMNAMPENTADAADVPEPSAGGTFDLFAGTETDIAATAPATPAFTWAGEAEAAPEAWFPTEPSASEAGAAFMAPGDIPEPPAPAVQENSFDLFARVEPTAIPVLDTDAATTEKPPTAAPPAKIQAENIATDRPALTARSVQALIDSLDSGGVGAAPPAAPLFAAAPPPAQAPAPTPAPVQATPKPNTYDPATLFEDDAMFDSAFFDPAGGAAPPPPDEKKNESIEDDEPVDTKPTGKRRIARFVFKTLGVIAVMLVSALALAFGAITVVCKGPFPTARELFVVSVTETSAVKFLAYIYFTPQQVEEILAANTLIVPDEVTDTTTPFDPPTPDAEQKDLEIIDITGPTYKGKMMIVQDPSRIQLATIPAFSKDAYGRRVEDLVADNDAIAGINAGGFEDVGGVGKGGLPAGIVIKDGRITAGAASASYSIIGISFENKLIVGTMTGQQALDLGVRDAVHFTPTLIVNGKAAEVGGSGGGLNPRTCIGQRADGAMLLLVIDGRQPHSLGATMEDCLKVMQDFEAVNAANLDGGSSSVMVYEGEIINVCSSLYGSRTQPAAFIVK